MSGKTPERNAPEAKPDRRRRHADDPSVPISVNLPLSLKERLDDAVVKRRATRNAVIGQALTMWLEQQERAAASESGERDGSSHEAPHEPEQ